MTFEELPGLARGTLLTGYLCRSLSLFALVSLIALAQVGSFDEHFALTLLICWSLAFLFAPLLVWRRLSFSELGPYRLCAIEHASPRAPRAMRWRHAPSDLTCRVRCGLLAQLVGGLLLWAGLTLLLALVAPFLGGYAATAGSVVAPVALGWYSVRRALAAEQGALSVRFVV